MSSGSEWAEGWYPSSQEGPLISLLVITTAGWATDDGKEEETNKSNETPLLLLIGPFPVKGRQASYLYRRQGPVLCLGRRWQSPWWPSPAAGLGEANQSCTTSPTLLPPLFQCPAPALKPAWVCILSSELCLSCGQELCWSSWGPHEGGMVTPALSKGSAQGVTGYRGPECSWVASFLKAQHLNGILRAVSHSL